jgi:predicted Zn-dependent protease
MEHLFNQLSDTLFSKLDNEEQLIINFQGEDTIFVRFNKSKVRQASDVKQLALSLTLKSHHKETEMTIPLGNNPASEALSCLTLLRDRLKTLEPLPFFVAAENNGQSNTVHKGDLLSFDEYLSVITSEIENIDLAGILVSGTIAMGNANSLGQRHWFENASFCFDYSLYTAKEKAVKAAYSGTKFIQEDFLASLSEAKTNIKLMSIPNRVLEPGLYQCYLAPAAVNEILGTFSWGGPSFSGLRRGNSPLQKMENEGKKLSPLFTLSEDFDLGLQPPFNLSGEVAAPKITIFNQGKLENLLTSTKTAMEFNTVSNNANDEESMRSPVISEGSLKKEEILSTLNNGIYISNLHYLNWSDESKGRITGMTRFACFLVENGEIVAPIKDLRFDETIYNIWGENLLAVTDFSETEVSTDTYFSRNPGGARCPGLLVKDFNFTL